MGETPYCRPQAGLRHLVPVRLGKDGRSLPLFSNSICLATEGPRVDETRSDQSYIIGKLLQATEAQSELISELIKDAKEANLKIAVMESSLKRLETSMTRLDVLIREGNGRESLIGQVGNLQTRLDAVSAGLGKVKAIVSRMNVVDTMHSGSWRAAWWGLALLAWLVPVVISVWAGWKAK